MRGEGCNSAFKMKTPIEIYGVEYGWVQAEWKKS